MVPCDSARIFEDAYYNGIEALPYLSEKTLGVIRHRICKGLQSAYKKNSYQRWKFSKYGKRWILESAFSAMKRMFGESVMAHKNMLHKMALG